MVDVKWTFSDHFRYVIGKMERVVRALSKLMPNLRGPNERRRRLYLNVVMSVVLYGAPVWGDIIARSKLLPALNSLQRTVTQRTISAYRSVSRNAALMLARLPPFELLAKSRRRVYERVKAARKDGSICLGVMKEIRESESHRTLTEWREILEKPNAPGKWTKLALVPHMEA